MKKAIIAVILLTAILSSACGFENRQVKLTLGVYTSGDWGVPNPDSLVLFDEAVERFESAHPNIQVSYRSGMLREDYSEWCAKQALQDTLPDVLVVLPENFGEFVSLGILQNLDRQMDGDADFHKEDYFSSALRAGQAGGSQYALPFEIAPTMMFVNKTLLSGEGIVIPDSSWTWEDFYNICRAVTRDTDHDGKADQYGCYGFTWEESAVTNGVEMFGEDGQTVRFSSDEFMTSVNFAKKINGLNGGVNLTSVDFDKGKVAFCPLAFSYYRAYKPYPYRVKKYSDFEWDCLPMPVSESGGYSSALQTLLMGVSSRSEHPDEAFELLKYFTSDYAMQMSLLDHSNGLPVIREVLESDEAAGILQKDMPNDENFIDMEMLGEVIESAYIPPNFQHYSAAKTLADGLLYPVIYGSASAESAVKTLQREATRLLKD